MLGLHGLDHKICYLIGNDETLVGVEPERLVEKPQDY